MRMHAIALGGLLAGCVVHGSRDSDVFGHEFAITVGHVEVAPRAPNGTPWDFDGSAPDPYAQLFVDGTLVLTTMVVSNSYLADWTDQVTRRIDRGTTLELVVWDSDPFVMGDLIARCGQGAPIAAAELRAGNLTCAVDGSLVTIYLDKVN